MNASQATQMYSDYVVALGGQILFDVEKASCTYDVLQGEVLLLRNGQMVDLVESGEVLDASLWDGAMAVAWTDCVLQPVLH